MGIISTRMNIDIISETTYVRQESVCDTDLLGSDGIIK